MRLYLADEEKLNTFILPQKAEESFLFSYTSSITNIEVFFNVYSKNENWYIQNNDDFIVNEQQSDILLENYKQYKIKIKGLVDTFYLYTYENYNNNYKDIVIDSLNSITIGNASNDSIVYMNDIMIPNNTIISKENELFYIENNKDCKTNIYINNRKINEKTLLNNGDIIFVNNLKLIWMTKFIRLLITNISINFSSSLQIKSIDQSINNANYLSYDIKENNEELFNEEEQFFHKPRLSISYEEEELNIDPPTQLQEKEDIPAIFTIGAGFTLVITSGINLYTTIIKYKNGDATKTELIISIITALFMVSCTFLLPKLANMYNKKRAKLSDIKREKKYTEYLTNKQAEINKIINYQRQSLYDNNPSSKECYDFVIGVKKRLWEREISDVDFLSVRVGLGNLPSSLIVNAPEEVFSLETDNLISRANNIKKNSQTLTNVPITISLCKNFVSSIICNFNNEEKYINGILLQLLALHSPKDLKIVFLTTEKNAYKWNYLKLIPHILSKDKNIRYFATNEEEVKMVLKEIEDIYNQRCEIIDNANDKSVDEVIEKDDMYKNFDTYYLIITDNHRKYNNIEFLDKLTKLNINLGFSLLLLGESLKSLPNECKKYTYVTDKSSCVFEKDYSKSNQTNFTTEIFDNIDMYRVARELSSVPIQSTINGSNLPNMISFLEMYNVGNIEQLNILNKWASSNPISSLSAPVGVSPSGELFKLDLHEKYHGPHGLIAGSTGSGKSEFIITYILSMAINYNPDEVQFVLIDYKGGGLAGAFENKETGIRIPHLSGTITNLDVSEMNRTLVSINSELKRRQKVFNEARDKLGESTIDIYKYQKYYREGLLEMPVPHLFIVSDEFAELKSQQPEFMDELISTARIGRSLGVHLILATQKPTGVVNDQIWSNSKFKVCLKVQTRSDSMEMLKRPEAASIKETGRFYLQVGYDELFEIGQSAWCGAPYNPTERAIKNVDDSINFIDNIGNTIKTANNINTKKVIKQNNGDQITNIVKYLNDIAKKNNIKQHKLWLDSIPKDIFLSDLLNKYNYTPTPYAIDAIIGEYDDPSIQKQGLLKVDLTNTGNLLIYGIPGSGKENLLTTIITSICIKHTTDEVNLYILDLGSETLNKFKSFPQVGDIVFIDETEKLNSFCTFLSKEIIKRKSLFADYSGNYVNYIKYSNKKLPNIICIINQYETLTENMLSLTDKLTYLFKEGQKYGITFIVTNSLSTGIRSKVLQLFPNKCALKLGEDIDYRMTVNAPRGLLPANFFGRGLFEFEKSTLEFQTAYIFASDKINTAIIDINDKLKKSNLKNAPKIPTMPNFFTVDKLINSEYTLSNVPVGISKNKLSICSYDFSNNFTPVLSTDLNENIHFIYGLIELLKQIPNAKVRIIDVLKIYNNVQGIDVYSKDFDTIVKQIKLEIMDDDNLKRTNIFIIIGLGALKNNIPTKTQKHFNDIFDKTSTYKKNKFIIYDEYNSYKSLETESWFRINVNTTSGIWLGENAGNQFSIKMPNLSLDERKNLFNQMGFIVNNSSHTIVKYIVDKEFDNEK